MKNKTSSQAHVELGSRRSKKTTATAKIIFKIKMVLIKVDKTLIKILLLL